MASEILSRLCCSGAGDVSSSLEDDTTTSIFSSLQVPKNQSWTYVPTGKCQLTAEFVPCKLLERAQVSDTTSILRFSLPDVNQPLNLSTCACILAKAAVTTEEDGKKRMEDVIRPYTPISTNDQIGSFDLLIRHYENGKMTQHLKHIKEGDDIDFKHIDFNVKIQAPAFAQYKFIGMIVGGTGITPMIQALHAIINSKEETQKTKVVVLYGSRDSTDILGGDLLTSWAKVHPEKLEVVHVLSNEPEKSSWTGKRGFISKELILEKFAPPSDGKEVLIMVCGPPPMYNVFCGPREAKELTGVLNGIGYNADQVYKF